MRRDDLELIKQAFEVLDSETFEQALPLVAEDFEMVTTRDVASEPDIYRGPDGIRRWFDSFLQAMDRVRVEGRHFHEAGDDQVIVEFRLLARGRQSGIEAGQDAIGLATVDDGKLARLEFFTSLEAARAAARSTPG
ncbi:MAG: nuclear transport factor 2 family protein [Chloroflexota bacterium]|nr:nuclear transport factor 2 family protein [Chloroflexota bacterium]